MKKISVLLLAFLLGAAFCIPVFADMGGPMMIGYSVTVTHETDYFDWVYDEQNEKSTFQKTGTIPAGTVIGIDNEYETNGEEYGSFSYGSGDNRVSGYVRLSDLRADVGKAPEFITAYKQGLTLHTRVTEAKGVTLYAGPSAVYDTVGAIPVGAELTIDTLDQRQYDESAWMYVTYNGQSGWMHCWLYDGTNCPVSELMPEGTTGTVWVVKDNAALRDRNGKEIIKVPKGEKLSFEAFNRSPHMLSFYVTYEGKTGVFNVSIDGENNVVASNRNSDASYRNMKLKQPVITGLYAYPDDSKPSGTVAFIKGETLSADYLFYAEPQEGYGGVEWYHIEKNGKSGWVKIEYDKFVERDWENNPPPNEIYELSNYNGSYTTEKIVIPAPDVVSKTSTTTAAAATTTSAPETTAAPFIPETAAAEPAEEESTEMNTAEYAQFEKTEPSTDVSAPTTMPKRQLPSVGIIAICVGAAGLLSMTALVTLRLIRRKHETE